ncbi:MAG: magnesium transporter, partial [Clostridia bacterium]|nr:magnesium transporter [Clostridia bacterium]
MIEKINTTDLARALSKIDNELLVKIFPKLPEEVSARVFVKFKTELQQYLIDNISGYEFKEISEELLEADVEKDVNQKVLNEILLKAEADTRHEKLLEIIDNIENRKFSSLKPLLAEMEPADIADLINDIDKEKVVVIFRLLPKDLASEVFVDMNADRQKMLIDTFTDAEVSNIINDLFVDDTVDIIEEMPSNVVIRLLKLSKPETRATLNKILGFPKDSAGSIMTTEFVTLRTKMTVSEALKKMRKQAIDKETIYTCYVTDDKKRLLGTVSAKDIILHKPNDKIGDFMQENVIYAHTNTDREEVSNMLQKYDLLAVPVVDNENRITGIVTIDDAIDIIQEESQEDISKMAGIAPTTKPYLQTNVFSIFKNRLPWLLILLISATFTGIIINVYESTLNSLSPLLFACVPMLMGTGGNSGSQASVTIIQSLATGEVELKDVLKVIWKEIRVAVIVAFVLAVACFGKLMLIDNLIFGYDYTFKISFVVSLSLFATICIAKLVGAILPLLAKKIKLDPAVVANPFITTIVDVISL